MVMAFLEGRTMMQIEWNGAIENWTKKFISKNLWRFEGSYEFDDLMQDCFIKFMFCRDKYKDTAENMAHFMSLYKRAVVNHFHDKANETTNHRHSDIEEVQNYAASSICFNNLGFLLVLIKEAPKEVQTVIETMILEGNSGKLRRPFRKTYGKRSKISGKIVRIRETTDEFLSRVMDIPELEENLRERVREYLLK